MLHSLATRRDYARRGYESYNLRGNVDTPARHGITDPELTFCWYTGQAAARQCAGIYAAFVSVRADNWIGQGLTEATAAQVDAMQGVSDGPKLPVSGGTDPELSARTPYVRSRRDLEKGR